MEEGGAEQGRGREEERGRQRRTQPMTPRPRGRRRREEGDRTAGREEGKEGAEETGRGECGGGDGGGGLMVRLMGCGWCVRCVWLAAPFLFVARCVDVDRSTARSSSARPSLPFAEQSVADELDEVSERLLHVDVLLG